MPNLMAAYRLARKAGVTLAPASEAPDIPQEFIDQVAAREASPDYQEALAAVAAAGGVIMYDSTNPSAIPTSASLVASYVDGYGGYSAAVARFGASKVISISVGGNPADVADVEPGAMSASDLSRGLWRVVYSDGSDYPSCLAVAGPGKSYWTATDSGQAGQTLPGRDAVQYLFSSGYDLSWVLPSFPFYPGGTITPPPPPPQFPLAQGSADTADVRTLQANLNRWATAVGLGTPLIVDGNFGSHTADAVSLAETHFGETPNGQCSQALFNLLKGNPVTNPPSKACAPPVHLAVKSSTASSAVIGFEYRQGGVPAEYFQIAVSAGASLGKVTAGYPKWVQYVPAAEITETITGLDTVHSEYVIAVRAANAAKQAGSPWATVVLPKGGKVTPPPPPSAYKNPLRDIAGLVPQRIDQGVDFAGAGPLYSLGSGTVLNVSNSGWPGGAFISVRLSDGPFAGKITYYAENITPRVTVGQQVTSDTALGTLIDVYPNCELGWAAEPGTGESLARASGQTVNPDNSNTAYGKNFSDLLHSLGAPAGSLSGPVVGTLPSNWPVTGGSVTPPVTGKYPWTGNETTDAVTAGKFFMDHGYSRAAASGICGCIAGEAVPPFNPESQGSGGRGLIGWTPPSTLPDSAFTGNPQNDFPAQLAQILVYNQIWSSYISGLNAQTDPVAAADYYSQNFERPAVRDSDVRPAVAQAVFAALANY